MPGLSFHKKSTNLLYVDRQGVTYYPTSGQGLTFTFPQASVRELEIIDEELFKKELTNFILSHKIPPAVTLIILSNDLLYEKEIIDKPLKKEDSNSEQLEVSEQTARTGKQSAAEVNVAERLQNIRFFIDTVPFEETQSKTYKIDTGVKVIATNKNLLRHIRQVLNKQGFIIEAFVPITMLGKIIGSIPTINQENVTKIFSKYELVKQNNLDDETTNILGEETVPVSHNIKMTTKVTSKREYVLISTFVILMGVLGFVSYKTFFVQPVETKRVASIVKKVSPTAIPSPLASASATPTASAAAEMQKNDIRIQINGGTEAQGNIFKQYLVSSGFTNITLQSKTTPATGKASILFSTTLPENIREQLVEEVQKSVLNVSVQEQLLTDYEVIINL